VPSSVPVLAMTVMVIVAVILIALAGKIYRHRDVG
jgi:hypothetical protein